MGTGDLQNLCTSLVTVSPTCDALSSGVAAVDSCQSDASPLTDEGGAAVDVFTTSPGADAGTIPCFIDPGLDGRALRCSAYGSSLFARCASGENSVSEDTKDQGAVVIDFAARRAQGKPSAKGRQIAAQEPAQGRSLFEGDKRFAHYTGETADAWWIRAGKTMEDNIDLKRIARLVSGSTNQEALRTARQIVAQYDDEQILGFLRSPDSKIMERPSFFLALVEIWSARLQSRGNTPR